MCYIYVLICPKTSNIRYVGKSTRPEQRLKEHIKGSENPKYPVQFWIQKLLKNNLKPTMQVLFKTDNWVRDEKCIIAACKNIDINLLNLADGGNTEIISNKNSGFRPSRHKFANTKITTDNSEQIYKNLIK